MRLRRFAIPALIVSALALGALQGPAAAESRRLALTEQISAVQLREGRNLKQPSGIFVSDPVSGEVLYGRNADQGLLSASTMKLVTAAVALETYAPGQRLETKVFWDAGRNAVTLVGAGDPTLSRTGLRKLAERVRGALPDAKKVSVYVDDSLFPNPRPAQGWVKGYVPSQVNPVSALPLMDVRSTKPVKTAGAMFSTALRNEGFRAAFKGVALHTGVEVASRASLPMGEIVKRMLLESDNNFAEHLFRLSALATGKLPTWQEAQKYAYAKLSELGVDTSHLVLADGSGLSRKNRLTARALGELLNIARNPSHPRLNRLLNDHLLPIAGESGTLKLRFGSSKTKCAVGQVEAKTGSLRDTIALAGYVHTDEGVATFSILVNGLQKSEQSKVRRQLDWIVSALAADC